MPKRYAKRPPILKSVLAGLVMTTPAAYGAEPLALTLEAVTATVTLHPDEHALSTTLTARVAAYGAESVHLGWLRLQPGLSIDAPKNARVNDGRLIVSFDPPLLSGQSRTIALSYRTTVDEPRENYVTPEQALLRGDVFHWYPNRPGYAESDITILAPPGWVVHGTGDEIAPGRFTATNVRFLMLVGLKDPHVIDKGSLRVAVTKANQAAAEPLMNTLAAQVAFFEALYGPGISKTLSVFESDFDGGYSVNGIIVLHPGAVAAFENSNDEAHLLAHEICHQWFGSTAGGHPWLTEGWCRYCELMWKKQAGPDEVAAFREGLARHADTARPGLSIREIDHDAHGWKSYEAVAYSRGALAFEKLHAAIGDDAYRRLVRRFLKRYRGQEPNIDAFMAMVQETAPSFDAKQFSARYLDVPFDPRTFSPRARPLTMSAKPAMALAAGLGIVLALAALFRRDRISAMLLVLAVGATVFLLWRGPGWIGGVWAGVSVGLTVVSLGAWMRRPRAAPLLSLGAVLTATGNVFSLILLPGAVIALLRPRKPSEIQSKPENTEHR